MKEQIEEIAKVLCINYGHCSECSLRNIDKDDTCSVYIEAEALYNAGYRKQKEGEWIENEDDFWVLCSACGWEIWDEFDERKTSYCPNCGASMKGGAE